ncbi:MAG TPA: glycosyltransferase family 2 protein [Planctomycetota bacterium]|nr:glycosyltransferase family 2 protein [Planctomycetota bacterium]
MSTHKPRIEPRPDVCAIIPCYNEARSIARIVRSVKVHAGEVFVIDDCSTDGTAEQARSAGATVITHSRNMGKGVALKTGFAAAAAGNFKAALTLDGDGQHDSTEIPLFLDAYDLGGCDIVLGNRMNDTRTMPFIRRYTNRFTSWAISRMVGIPIRDTQCGFRLVALDFWRAVRLDSSRFDLESEILIKAARGGARIREVQIRTIYFGTDASKIHPVLDTLRFFQLLWRCRNA